MKTATLPAVRVSPETRSLIESVLKEGETLSTFIEESAKRQAGWRKEDEVFYAGALRASALVKAGKMRTHTQEEVMASLRSTIEEKKRDKVPAKQSPGK